MIDGIATMRELECIRLAIAKIGEFRGRSTLNACIQGCGRVSNAAVVDAQIAILVEAASGRATPTQREQASALADAILAG